MILPFQEVFSGMYVLAFLLAQQLFPEAEVASTFQTEKDYRLHVSGAGLLLWRHGIWWYVDVPGAYTMHRSVKHSSIGFHLPGAGANLWGLFAGAGDDLACRFQAATVLHWWDPPCIQLYCIYMYSVFSIVMIRNCLKNMFKQRQGKIIKKIFWIKNTLLLKKQ